MQPKAYFWNLGKRGFYLEIENALGHTIYSQFVISRRHARELCTHNGWLPWNF